MGLTAANVSSWLSGSNTADTGTRGKPIGASHFPPVPASGAEPSTLISAADDQGPRLPASVNAVNLIYRALSRAKVTVFSLVSSAQVPTATGALHVLPSMLTAIE